MYFLILIALYIMRENGITVPLVAIITSWVMFVLGILGEFLKDD